MNRAQAYALVQLTFTQAFDKSRFANLSRNLVNHLDESKAFARNSQYVKDAFKGHVQRFERLGTYTSPDQETLDVLIVHLTSESKLERARTALRNFVADHLKTRDEKDAALVAFVSPSEATWRFSYIKMEYATVEHDSGRVGVEARLTPARRFSYIVGQGESCHTAQTRFLDLLQETATDPMLADLEAAFSVEAVTKEFFTQYVALFGEIHTTLEKLAAQDKAIRDEFAARGVSTVDWAKKLMGQIVFLYFLQKKGWLGAARGQDWGSGPHDFLRRLANGEYGRYSNFFNDLLEPLFYDTLATDRGHEAWCERFDCRIPFLNGGLFEPLGNYDWRKTDILLPNTLFTNADFVEEGIAGTGVLDVFDRYNFTVNEAEPLEKEVAIDPEMLGKVFENLIEENRRKGLGAFYTPREIVHYMCRESLINYLDTALNPHPHPPPSKTGEGEGGGVPRADIETFVHLGEQISHYEAVETEYAIKMPQSIQEHARLIDEKLAEIAICDPAVGSGAFPVGMMTEIVRARGALTPYFNDVHERTPYYFKRHAIQNCLYGVDIDAGAVEIARLRLWLSLVVDEEDIRQIRPLPNLDFKIVAGNSLLGLPFKSQRAGEIEKLKAHLFDETDHAKKAQLKAQVDQLLAQVFAASKKSLGYEVNFDFEIFFSEVFREKGGFDVVIGNPPYGAAISPTDLERIKPRMRETTNSNSAALFIDLAKNAFSHNTGTVSFIVPKSLLFSEDWFSLVKSMLGKTIVLVDVEKAFEKVLLEQVVFVLARNATTDCYLARKFLDSTFIRDTVIPNQSALLFEAWVCDVSKSALGLAEKLRRTGIPLGSFVTCFRGFPIQHAIKAQGDYPVIGGKNIGRYQIAGVKGYLTNSDYTRLSKKLERISQPKLMAQNLVAHIQNPTPHVQLATAIDESGEVMNLDTITNIIPNSDSLPLKFLLAILNSQFASWYAYRFIYCSAIRTMHFDKYYVGKLPIPNADAEKQQTVIRVVNRILTAKRADPAADTSAWEHEIDQLVYQLYGLTEEEIAIVEGTIRP